MRATPRLLTDDDRDRFNAKVAKPTNGGDGCWFWTGGLSDRGYGQLSVDGRVYAAHRLALATALGRDLPGWEWALHGCDEPSCARVDDGHLRAGNPKQNRHDTIAHGRVPSSGEADRRGPRGRAVAIRDAIGGRNVYDPVVIGKVQSLGEPVRLFPVGAVQ